MYPPLSWYQEELMYKSKELWTKIWIITQSDSVKHHQQSQSQQLEDELLLKLFESLKNTSTTIHGRNMVILGSKNETFKRNKASTCSINLPTIKLNKLTMPWLNKNIVSNNYTHLICHDKLIHSMNPARYLLSLNTDVPIIELDKGFLG